MKKLNYLNLGCGTRYHKDWTNLDFESNDKDVISHNLLKGIPFEDNRFEVVYHSHVLEHFSKSDGVKLIEECYRVLKPSGILRIAIPDLERIAREYLSNMEKAIEGDTDAEANYDWILLEMYDQTVRNQTGGFMADYIFQKEIPNEEYIYQRIGNEGRELRQGYLNSLNQPTKKDEVKISSGQYLKGKVKSGFRRLKNLFKKNNTENQQFTDIGRFRLGGEIHQWMYDRFSLTRLLKNQGFQQVAVKSSFESDIPNWNIFEIEHKGDVIFKPDSLFIEAIK